MPSALLTTFVISLLMYLSIPSKSFFTLFTYLIAFIIYYHVFVLIFLANDDPKYSASASLIELGWALAFSKAVLVFYDNKNSLPPVLKHLSGSEYLHYYKDYHIPSKEDVFQYIYHELLEELDTHLDLNLEK